MTPVAIVVVGALAVVAAREMLVTIRTSSFRVRGRRRRLQRDRYPRMYWANIMALGLACAGGLFMIGLGLSR